MVKSHLSLAPVLRPSPDAWLELVLENFDEFLRDHASCEKKASGMAMSVAAHYPDQPDLVTAMVDLAVEELNHYREVIRILLARGLTPGPDHKDPYIHKLNALVRRGPENFLLDRLLIGAVVERRGAERFACIATGLNEPELRKFYGAITKSEEQHWHLFIDLALNHYAADTVWSRFRDLSEQENSIMTTLPLRSALH